MVKVPQQRECKRPRGNKRATTGRVTTTPRWSHAECRAKATPGCISRVLVAASDRRVFRVSPASQAAASRLV